MVTSKVDIRKEKLRFRRRLSEAEINDLNKEIFSRVINFDEFKLTNNILIYSDYNNEVHTKKIIETALKDRKSVYLPKVLGDEMEFYEIDDFDGLQVSSQGILEPTNSVCSQFNGNEFALVLVPLSAFDRNGNRIGYGGGYYDKYLSKHIVGTKVGLAYSFQETEYIDAEETDIKLDYVITEKEVIEVSK